MNEDNFPPLPKFFTIVINKRGHAVDVFDADQMREYGRLVAEECAKFVETEICWGTGCDEASDINEGLANAMREKFGVKK